MSQIVMKEDPGGQLSGTQQCFQDREPKDFVMKIESFSMLFKNEVTRCESSEFQVGGYKWKLIFYPNGNKKKNGEDQVSLYLSISDTASVPPGWKVEANFNLFVYNHVSQKYLTFKLERPSEFNWLQKEFGFARILPLKLFKDPSTGYLVDDTCVFGAEIFVCNPVAKRQTLSMQSITDKNVFTYKLTRFSRRNHSHFSDSFKFGVPGVSVEIRVDPNGHTHASRGNISLYLLIRSNRYKENSTHFAVFKMRVVNQIRNNHVEKLGSGYFTPKLQGCGWCDFMSRSDVMDKSKGFLEDDTLTVEFEIVTMGLIK